MKLYINAKGIGGKEVNGIKKATYYRTWFFRYGRHWILILRYFKFVLYITWVGSK
jgi:hypothetical protein